MNAPESPNSNNCGVIKTTSMPYAIHHQVNWTPPDIESGPETSATASSTGADGVDVASDVDADGTAATGGASSDALNGRLETVAEEAEIEGGEDSFGASQDLEGQLEESGVTMEYELGEEEL